MDHEGEHGGEEPGAGAGGDSRPRLAGGEPPGPAPPRSPLRALGALLLVATASLSGVAIGQSVWGSGSLPRVRQVLPLPAGPPSPGGPADAAAVAAKVDPGLVDVNTTLGLLSAQAAGTGMVLTPSGEVLTNNHVINGATSVNVTDVGDGQTYPATVVGYSRSADVAVLQLQGASHLATVPLGDSSSVQVNDPVLALGNAGGVGGTPSTAGGAVTALNRSITASDESSGVSEQLTGLIETDAAIQPGDSGGPLANAAGKVVGMNTAASSGFSFDAGSTQGFAIPIDTALAVAHQIVARQASSSVHIGATAFLGVGVRNPPGNSIGVPAPTTRGALVQQVFAGMPAARAGVGVGDVIVSVDGSPVRSTTALTGLLDQHHPGDTIRLGWLDTSGRSHSAAVSLATGPAG